MRLEGLAEQLEQLVLAGRIGRVGEGGVLHDRRCHAWQVLVLHDLLGLYGGFTPKFTKRYAEIGEQIRGALERFAGDVRSGAFPTDEHTYAMPAEELEAFLSSPPPRARTET